MPTCLSTGDRPTVAPERNTSSGRRLVSLDVLRGVTVALMILVNTAGDGKASFAQLRHSVWNGCTLTDLVFPMFLFLMGVSLTISFATRLARKASRVQLAAQALRRSATIILLGLALNALPFFHLATLRYCGVLQRIGICYLIAAMLLLVLHKRGLIYFVLTVLLGYWALMALMPLPGYGRNGMELGLLNPVANLSSLIDRTLIPQAHLYHQSFYDPEGILSTLPAVATVVMGALTGLWLTSSKTGTRPWLLLGGSVLLLLLAFAWNLFFPFNKRLWTSSYVLLTAGVSVGLLVAFHWLLDREKPLVSRAILLPGLAFGSNALFAYLLSEVLSIAIGAISFPGHANLQQFSYSLIPLWAGSPPVRSLEWSILFTALCFAPVYGLYRKRIFIKL